METQTTNSHTPLDPIEQGHVDALNALTERLAPEGWTCKRNRKGLKANWRWLSIDLRYRPESPDAPWRARVRDGMPWITVYSHESSDPVDAARHAMSYALQVESFCVGGGLFSNPSKAQLAHRLWQATRPY